MVARGAVVNSSLRFLFFSMFALAAVTRLEASTSHVMFTSLLVLATTRSLAATSSTRSNPEGQPQASTKDSQGEVAAVICRHRATSTVVHNDSVIVVVVRLTARWHPHYSDVS